MSELWIHIGSHKTGTTAIQKACRNALLETGPNASHYFDNRRLNERIDSTMGEGAEFTCKLDLAAAERVFRPDAAPQPPKRFLMSEEGLFWISEPHDVHALADILHQRFESVKILAYLRRQDKLALSHRKQVAMRFPAVNFYGASATPLPVYQPHFQKYFDYAAKLTDIWCSAFGKQNVHVVPYERANLVGGDAVTDFAFRTGASFAQIKEIVANKPLSGNKTYLGLKLAQAGVPMGKSRKIVQQLAPQGSFLPSRDEARAFLQKFEESNLRLSRDWTWEGRPFAFDQDFDMYPEQPPGFTQAQMEAMLDRVLPFLKPQNSGK